MSRVIESANHLPFREVIVAVKASRCQAYAKFGYRPEPPIRALDIPGMRSIEDRMPFRSGVVAPELQKDADEVSRQTFGITRNNTWSDYPDDFESLSDSRKIAANEKWDRHERRFETTDLPDDKRRDVLKRLGIDFSDERGWPLRCIRLFDRQVEAASKHIVGKMPDRDSIRAAKWGSNFEADAHTWQKKRRAKGP
jgi:hypothetical protein